MDVGLAQARQPLTTRCHYYELEIVDAGEKCYIALGLARRVSFLRKEQVLTTLLKPKLNRVLHLAISHHFSTLLYIRQYSSMNSRDMDCRNKPSCG